jgi:hypothetical protein
MIWTTKAKSSFLEEGKNFPSLAKRGEGRFSEDL